MPLLSWGLMTKGLVRTAAEWTAANDLLKRENTGGRKCGKYAQKGIQIKKEGCINVKERMITKSTERDGKVNTDVKLNRMATRMSMKY